MAATAPAPPAITLRGAPDAHIGRPDPKHAPVQVLRLDLSADVVDDLVRTARSGKQPQILFGRAPTLRYGTKTLDLETTPEKVRHELYRADGSSRMEFQGLVSARLAIKATNDAAAGVDAALAQLKSSLATIQQEKDANKTTIIPLASDVPGANRRKAPAKPRHDAALARKLPARNTASSAPAASHSSSSSLSASKPASGPHSQPVDISKALRLPLVHLLALRPATVQELASKTRSSRDQCAFILPKVARQADPAVGQWQLTDRAYKELDVWKFPYPSREDRQAAIDNAVRAFDRLRLSREEQLWQMLLPKEERGKGKILSRLNLHAGPLEKKVATPVLKAKPNAKPLPAKKAEASKPSKGKEAKGKAAGKDSGEAQGTPTGLKPKPAPAKKASNDASASKAAKPSAKSPAAPAQSKAPKPSASSAPERKGTGSARTSISSTGSKPKIPSPLSASPMVPAATHSAAASPLPPNSDRSLKRKANNLDDDVHRHDVTGAKQRKMHPRSDSSASSASFQGSLIEKVSALKRKAPHPDQARPSEAIKPAPHPTKQRRIDTPGTTSITKPNRPAAKPSSTSLSHPTRRPAPTHSASSSISSTATAAPPSTVVTTTTSSSAASMPSSSPSPSSVTSPLLPLSFRQTLEHAQKFKRYYDRYFRLYTRLATAPEPPSQAERRQLLRMHEKLSVMKGEIGSGVLKQ